MNGVVNNGSRNCITRVLALALRRSKNILVESGDRRRRAAIWNRRRRHAQVSRFKHSGDNSIHVPLGTGLPGELTKTVTLVGNLSAQAIGPLAQVLTSATPLTIVPAQDPSPSDFDPQYSDR